MLIECFNLEHLIKEKIMTHIYVQTRELDVRI